MATETVAAHWGQLIGLERPWEVREVELSHEDQEVRIRVVRGARPRLRCPECDRVCGGYDTRERRWRHLDTMQYRTILIAEIPRAAASQGILERGRCACNAHKSASDLQIPHAVARFA